MKTVVPDYFYQFRCLAGDCPDTCCGPWEIVIDPETKAKYMALEGPLGEKIRSCLTVADGEDCFVPVDGLCPMLDEHGLCPIISQLGPEALSITCDEHPRFTEIYGGYAETMLCVSCPEAARLLLEREEPLTFLAETDDTPPEPNDLDGDLFQLVLLSRETAFRLVQDRSRPMADRLALLLCFADRLEKNLERFDLCMQLCELYQDANYQQRQLVRIRRLRKYGTMIRIRQRMNAMDPLTEAFPEVLKELEVTSVESIALEQLTMYFLFRWWLKAACNGYLWRQAAAVVVSVLSVASLAGTTTDLKDAARLYSKEVEHSDDNMALLHKAMDLPQFGRNELLKLLEVPHAI